MQHVAYVPDEGEPTARGEFAPLLSVMLFPDERHVLAAASHCFFVWDVDSRACWYQHDLGSAYLFADVPFSLRPGPERTFLSSYGRNEFAQWSLDSFELLRVFSGHRDYVEDGVFLGARQVLSCCGVDSAIRRWDLATGRCLDTALVNAGPRRLADGEVAGQVAVGVNRGFELLERDTLQQVAFHELVFEPTDYNASWPSWTRSVKPEGLVWCPATRDLLVAGRDAFVRRIDTRRGEVLARWLGHTAAINDLALLPGGRGFVTASDDASVRFWSFDRNDCIASHELGGRVPGVAVSSRGRVFAACTDGMVYAIDPPAALCVAGPESR